MSTYRVQYTTYIEVEADSADEAMNIAATIPMGDFIFLDEEVEEIEED